MTTHTRRREIYTAHPTLASFSAARPRGDRLWKGIAHAFARYKADEKKAGRTVSGEAAYAHCRRLHLDEHQHVVTQQQLEAQVYALTHDRDDWKGEAERYQARYERVVADNLELRGVQAEYEERRRLYDEQQPTLTGQKRRIAELEQALSEVHNNLADVSARNVRLAQQLERLEDDAGPALSAQQVEGQRVALRRWLTRHGGPEAAPP